MAHIHGAIFRKVYRATMPSKCVLSYFFCHFSCKNSTVFIRVIVLLFVLLPQSLMAESQSDMNRAAFYAIKNGDLEAVQNLIEKGMDPNYRLGERENAMGLAAFYERPVILEELISAGGNADHKLKSGMYFIRFVASRNNLELLKVVVSESSDLNKLMYHDQYTVFIGILREIDIQTLEYVLENTNADVNYRPDNGNSALYHLYDRGQCGLDCIEILLRNCADPMLEVNPGGESFEDYITRINDIEVLKLINETECYNRL